MPKQTPPGANDCKKQAENYNRMEEDPNREPPPSSEAQICEQDGGSPCEEEGATGHRTSTSQDVLRMTEEGKNAQKRKRNFQMPPLSPNPSSSDDYKKENGAKEPATTLLGGPSKDDDSPKKSDQDERIDPKSHDQTLDGKSKPGLPERIDPKSHDQTLDGKSKPGLPSGTFCQQAVVASARTVDSFNCPPDGRPIMPSGFTSGNNKLPGEISPHISKKPETPERSSPKEIRSRESAHCEGKSGVNQASAESRDHSDRGERPSPQSLSSSQHTDPAPQASRTRQTQARNDGAECGARSPPTDEQAKPEEKAPSSAKVANKHAHKKERVASQSDVSHNEPRTPLKSIIDELDLYGSHEIDAAGGIQTLQVYTATTSGESSSDARPLQQSSPQSASQSLSQSSPQSLPRLDSQSSLQSAPQSLPQSASEPLSQSASQSLLQSSPQSSPQLASQSSLQSAPQSLPQSASQSSPQLAPQSSPQLAPKSSPQSASQSSLQPVPQSSPQSAPQSLPQSTLQSDVPVVAPASCSTHEQTTNNQTTSQTENDAAPESPRMEDSLLSQNGVPQAVSHASSQPGAGPVQAPASPTPCSRRQPTPVQQPPSASLQSGMSQGTLSPSVLSGRLHHAAVPASQPPNSQQRPVLVLRRVPQSRPRRREAQRPGLRLRRNCVIRTQGHSGRPRHEEQRGSQNTPSVFVVDLHQRAVDMSEHRDLIVDARDLLSDIDLHGPPREITGAGDLILRSWGPHPEMAAGNAEWFGLPAGFQRFLDEGQMGHFAAFLASLTPGGSAGVLCVVCQLQEVNVHLFPCHHRPLCRLCLVRNRLCRCPLQHCCQLIVFFFQFQH